MINKRNSVYERMVVGSTCNGLADRSLYFCYLKKKSVLKFMDRIVYVYVCEGGDLM